MLLICKVRAIELLSKTCEDSVKDSSWISFEDREDVTKARLFSHGHPENWCPLWSTAGMGALLAGCSENNFRSYTNTAHRLGLHFRSKMI
jgi:hypothetical protein